MDSVQIADDANGSQGTCQNEPDADSEQGTGRIKKAVIYCRKSTNNRSKEYIHIEELSIMNQKSICEEYCAKYGLAVNDNDVVCEVSSARDMTSMAELHKLLKRLEPNTLLVVADTTRFSRNVRQALDILEKLRKNNIYVQSVNNYCRYDNNSLNRFQFRFHLSQAELESDQISDRVKKSVQNRRKIGCKIGNSRYGYESYYDSNGLRRERINDDEQKVIATINKYKKDGYNPNEIVQILNDEGITFRGKAWNVSRIRYVLRGRKFHPYDARVTVSGC